VKERFRAIRPAARIPKPRRDNPVDVTVEVEHGVYIAWTSHVVNRSHHALSGTVRAAWRRYPNALSVEARFA
jgi:hypothetical protein